ncbi:hypothetical protein J5226_07375 [Lysobacter sp. K5869]|uniref:hypothetical protein n=1 Tax=Lysobacter sp. K5869 TaxID=2820808 RepID=UPI001C05F890|nr:hypothetical protein [Lysobacter sp. K5869]QWP78207.1 hypothetical protein J5226_07375 [Lysobacter sp. K5869]
MAYFSIPSLSVPAYRFDYHSHFNGILPVKGDATLGQSFDDGQGPAIAADQPLSLVGLYGFEDGRPGWRRRGAVSLFVKALRLMEQRNPLLDIALQPRGRQVYQRGECVGENIYIAAVWLADRLGLSANCELAATDPALYAGVRNWLELIQGLWSQRGEPERAGDEIEALLPMLEHFNAKIYSASKYTPFDDAYFARSFAAKLWLSEQSRADAGQRPILTTLMFLQQQGIANAQIALGPSGIEVYDDCVGRYNARFGTCYKLLAHSSEVYASDEAFAADLLKLKRCIADPALGNVVGFDLLGAENKVGGYLTYFKFLSENRDALTARFGVEPPPQGQPGDSPDPPKLALKLVNHIHCGEGMGVAADNRSAIGYAMAYLGAPLPASFYPAFSRYVLTCVEAARSREADNRRGTLGTPDAARAPGEHVSGLFDELFRNDSLTVDGLLLRRYDGNSERTRQLAAYTGKRNMMAISEALDTVPATPARDDEKGENYYQVLMDGDRPMAFRLGHAYYYRSYVAARYPELAFDTNLGSNAITGASGLFDSSESYRLNRGLRHLHGYVDTNLIQELTDRVMYTGVRSLDRIEVRELLALARRSPNRAAFLDAVQAKLPDLLGKAMAPVFDAFAGFDYRQCFLTLLGKMIGRSPSRALWFDASARVLALFANWRSYLLGADGQGVEHTDSRNEYLRCALLMAYSLMPLDPGPQGDPDIDPDNDPDADPDDDAALSADIVGATLQALIDAVSAAYWATTIGPPAASAATGQPPKVGVKGYKAPDSVVTIFASAAP